MEVKASKFKKTGSFLHDAYVGLPAGKTEHLRTRTEQKGEAWGKDSDLEPKEIVPQSFGTDLPKQRREACTKVTEEYVKRAISIFPEEQISTGRVWALENSRGSLSGRRKQADGQSHRLPAVLL